MSRSAELDLHLHPKQGEALNTRATEVLYGGAAGGGKSHLMRVAAILWCAAIPGLQVYIFRRIRDDLVKNHMEGPKGFRSILAGWVLCGFADIVEDEIRFWNGSKIYLCHCKDAKDVYKYQGAEIHVLLIDELTHFTEAMYRFLRSRVRMVGLTLPQDYRGKFPRILCGSNPGNIGHLWVKTTFVTSAVPMTITQTVANDGGMLRQFIPALLEDNPSMAEDDPSYEGKLSGIGSEALVKAMRYGDWDVIEGAFFDCWESRKHVIDPIPIPDHWLRFRSMDWGSAAPFSVGWWAVASEPVVRRGMVSPVEGVGQAGSAGQPNGRQGVHVGAAVPPLHGVEVQAVQAVIPRGALIRYREWYGQGQKLTAEEVAQGIVKRETYTDEHGRSQRENIAYGVLDPSAFAEDGGPSIAERMAKSGALFRPADNRRVPQAGAMGGWDQMRARMKGDADGNPMLMVFSTCRDFIRTVPVLQHDPDRPEDLDTAAEDHAADEGRYACMSRPWTRAAPVPDGPLVDVSKPRLADLVKRHDQRRRAGAVGRI